MSISSTEIIRIIQNHRLRVFTTGDIQTLAGMSAPAATKALQRLAACKLVTRLKRGLWVNQISGDMDPFEAVAYLRAPWPCYVSLYSALAFHGVVQEIPHIVYAVSPAHPVRYTTPIGAFHVHHLPQRLMWGYDIRTTRTGSYAMADAEKAFLDLAYLSLMPRCGLRMPHRRSQRWELDTKKLREYAKRFKMPRLMGIETSIPISFPLSA